MSATVTMKLHEVQVYENKDGRENVIGLVRWTVEFSRGQFVSRAGVETLLDVSSLSNFTPIEQVTREQVLAWAAAAQGGDAFVEHLRPYHEDELDLQERRTGLSRYTGISVDPWPRDTRQSAIPQQVL